MDQERWGVREKRTERISYYYDFGGDDGEDGDIDTDPTDADSTPIAGMNPILFYGLVGGVITLIVAIGALIYFKNGRNEKRVTTVSAIYKNRRWKRSKS